MRPLGPAARAAVTRREAVRSLYIVKIEIITDQRVMMTATERMTWVTEVERKVGKRAGLYGTVPERLEP
jgi:1,2-phenylacetyl-CoA epoxidase PaaB subunit